MKNFAIILISLMFLFTACVDKKEGANKNSDLDAEQIIQVENETDELETLDTELKDDIKDLDLLLEEIDN